MGDLAAPLGCGGDVSGLCGSCVYRREIPSPRGPVYLLCEQGIQHPDRFPKYPTLPVRRCSGWMAIRAAAAQDLPSIQRIYAYWVRHGLASFELEPPDLEEMTRRHREVAERGLPYLVAEAPGGVIAGYAYAALYRPRQAYRFTVEDSIYLDPALVGRGIGRKLLGAVIDDCARQGYKQMIAVIGGGLENRASVRLHAALGFEHAGLLRSVGWKFERWADTALMQRDLSPGM